MNLEEVGWGGVDWMIWFRIGQVRAPVNAVVDPRAPKMLEIS
jgi:hypothetical protein